MRPIAIIGLSLLLALPSLLHADATGGPYELRRTGFSSGAGRSTGGPYELQASMFRPDASTVVIGGNYRLTGGLLVEAGPGLSNLTLFRDSFEGN